MTRVITTLAVAAALVAPASASATTPWHQQGHDGRAPVARHNGGGGKHGRHADVRTKAPAKTIFTIDKIHSVIEQAAALPNRDRERAGYCSPVPLPRVGEAPGVFMNLYADDAARALYLAAGLVDAKKDAVTGSISC